MSFRGRDCAETAEVCDDAIGDEVNRGGLEEGGEDDGAHRLVKTRRPSSVESIASELAGAAIDRGEDGLDEGISVIKARSRSAVC
jgi:hypothetical protein